MKKAYHVYTKPICPYCDKAKNALTMKGHDFDTTLLESDEARAAFLSKLNGWRTFPTVFEIDPSTRRPIRFVGDSEALIKEL